MMNCYQFTVVGAGPAAICAIANLLAHLAPGGEILWVDPAFQVGDFGSCLSAGSSVPGNTTVASYQRVNHAIYKMFPSCRPAKNKVFELDTLEPDVTCKLKIAAAPLLHISHGLRQLVQNIEGRVTQIHSTLSGFDLSVTTNNNKTINVRSKKVILATGASPKSFISKQNNIIGLSQILLLLNLLYQHILNIIRLKLSP
jgi:pyruvate/2-oxoglutarate dehydrogenase complex dihydrolipoamide dehydrogenase (E3) component